MESKESMFGEEGYEQVEARLERSPESPSFSPSSHQSLVVWGGRQELFGDEGKKAEDTANVGSRDH